MKLLLQTIKFILGVAIIGFMHVAIAFLLPPPFNTVHIIFIAIVMVLFLYEHGSIVWFGALLSIMLDFPSLYPFGISLVSGTIATTVMLLLYRNIFTNRSLYAAMMLLSIGYICYRGIFVLFDVGMYILFGQTFDLLQHLSAYGIELIMTLLGLIAIYSFTSKFSYQLQHTNIQESWFRTLRNE